MKRRPRRNSQRGFTLIELMVALVVSSLLVGMILAIFIRMSVAYRGQQQVAEVQGKLAAARAQIEMDAKHAGLNMANGFTLGATGLQLHSPIRIINNNTSPDSIALFYADTMVQAAPLVGAGTVCDATQCDGIDSTVGFVPNDLVVMSKAGAVPAFIVGGAQVARFDACVLQIATMSATSLTFSTAAPWGSGGNAHCAVGPSRGATMYYKLVAHAWRIDPARPGEGVLQLSKTGDLVGVNDWQDQGYGFTDIQVATRFYEQGDLATQGVDTLDPDTDPLRDWYSEETQELRTAPGAGPFIAPIQVSISLVARTERNVEGIASASTPELTVPLNPNNNAIGDRAAVPLPSVTPELSGNRIFRYTTFQVDLRNLGVGR